MLREYIVKNYSYINNQEKERGRERERVIK